MKSCSVLRNTGTRSARSCTTSTNRTTPRRRRPSSRWPVRPCSNSPWCCPAKARTNCWPAIAAWTAPTCALRRCAGCDLSHRSCPWVLDYRSRSGAERRCAWIRGTDADYLQERTHSMTSHILGGRHRSIVRRQPRARRRVRRYRRCATTIEQRPQWHGLDLIQAGMIEWWLPDNLLALADRLTMAHSLELRCPFLDTEFADCCRRLPAAGRAGFPWHRTSSKVALKHAAISRLGADFVELPKLGFVNPANQWLSTRLAQQAQHEMARDDSFAATLFSRDFRREFVGQRSGWETKPIKSRPGALILLNRWADRWM